MTRLLMLLLCLAFAACSADVQGYTPPGTVQVSGLVRDAVSGKAIAEAKITVGEARLATDADGGFLLAKVAVGKRLLRAEAPEYQVIERELQVGSSGLNLDLLLFPLNATAPVGGNNANATPPLLTALSASSVMAGAALTLTGSGFGAVQAGGQVLIGGVSAQVTSWSGNAISVLVPPTLTPGLAEVNVIVDGAASAALTVTVMVGATSLPAVVNLSVGAGVPGSAVTLSGVRFGATQGASVVSFSGLATQVLSWTDTSITVAVPPALAPGDVEIVVVIAGKASNALTFVVIAPVATVPAAPSGVTGQANGAFTVSISWIDNAVDEDGFIVERKVGASAYGVVAQVGANFTQFADFGVDEQLSYTYRVRAFNAAGQGAVSNAAIVATPASSAGGPAPTPPAAPSSLVSNVLTPFSVRLTWVSNSAGLESGFWLQRRTNTGSFVWLVTMGSGVTTFDDESVTPGNTYEYRVRSFNSGGNSVYITSNTAATPGVVPVAPGNLAATAMSPVEVILTWSDYAQNETGYVVERKTGAGAYTALTFVAAETVSHADLSVLPGQSYTYRVKGINAVGASPYSSAAAAYTPELPPAAPTGFLAVAAASKITLTWTDVATNELGYRVYRAEGAGGSVLLSTLNAGSVTFDDFSVRSGQAYTYRLYAYNTAGEVGGTSASATAPLMAPSAPLNLAVSALSSSQAILSWTNGTNLGTEIRVQRATGNGVFSTVATINPTAVYQADSGLTASTAYRWQLVQFSTAGTAASGIVTLTMPAAGTGGGGGSGTPPNAPTTMSATYTSDYYWGSGGTVNFGASQETVSLSLSTQVRLNWTDTSSDEFGFITEQKWGNLEWTTGRMSQPNDTVSILDAPDGLLSYRVSSYSLGGASGYSNVATLYTLMPPSNVKSLARGTQGIILSWDNISAAAINVQIERSADNGLNWSLVATVAPLREFYADATAINRARYQYRLSTLDGVSRSAYASVDLTNSYWEPQWGRRDMSAVWTLSSSFAISVGRDGFIQEYDGAGWLPMVSPTSRNLSAVWGTAANNVWAAGERGTLLHYDGVSWTQWVSPVRGNLKAIYGTSASDIWIVGSQVYDPKTRVLATTIMHWNGSTWSAMEAPAIDGLRSVWAIAVDNAWAVGANGLILHWNGSAWSKVASPTNELLTSISGVTASQIYMAGSSGMVFVYNGSTWQAMVSPAAGGIVSLWTAALAPLYALTSQGDVWAHSGSWSLSTSLAYGQALHASVAGNVFAVGRRGARQFDGIIWTDITPPLAGKLRGTSASRIVVQGALSEWNLTPGSATFYAFDGIQWQSYSDAPAGVLYNFAVTDNASVVARPMPSNGQPLFYRYQDGVWQSGPGHTKSHGCTHRWNSWGQVDFDITWLTGRLLLGDTTYCGPSTLSLDADGQSWTDGYLGFSDDHAHQVGAGATLYAAATGWDLYPTVYRLERRGPAASVVAGNYETCVLIDGAALCTNYQGPQVVSGWESGVSAIAIGGGHKCAVINGAAMCWGENWAGQLGDGTSIARYTPIGVSSLSSGVTAITAGAYHTCAIVNGAAKCWGYNGVGQLGDGSDTSSNVPIAVSGLTSGVTAITAGGSHTCAIVNGAAKCWGQNDYGKLGDASQNPAGVPVAVSGLTIGVTSIAAGNDHTCAIVSGAAKCWGRNYDGQLGDASNTDSNVPVAVSGLSSGVTAISVGNAHSCAVVNGVAKCWGFNGYGQLGNGTFGDTNTPTSVTGLTSGVTAASAGENHSCAIVNGDARCWGNNSNRALGSEFNDGALAIPVNMQIPALRSQGQDAFGESVVDIDADQSNNIYVLGALGTVYRRDGSSYTNLGFITPSLSGWVRPHIHGAKSAALAGVFVGDSIEIYGGASVTRHSIDIPDILWANWDFGYQQYDVLLIDANQVWLSFQGQVYRLR